MKITKEEKFQDVRMAGARAHHEGFSFADNPFGPQLIREAWDDGWRRYQELLPSDGLEEDAPECECGHLIGEHADGSLGHRCAASNCDCAAFRQRPEP